MNVFGRNHSGPGCGFLSPREIDALVEGRLAASRLGRFRRHRSDGCGECLHLEAAVEIFRDVTENGILQAERKAFSESRRALAARLRQEVETRIAEESGRKSLLGLPWNVGRSLSSDELEQIAAAGTPDLADAADEEDEPDAN